MSNRKQKPRDRLVRTPRIKFEPNRRKYSIHQFSFICYQCFIENQQQFLRLLTFIPKIFKIFDLRRILKKDSNTSNAKDFLHSFLKKCAVIYAITFFGDLFDKQYGIIVDAKSRGSLKIPSISRPQ